MKQKRRHRPSPDQRPPRPSDGRNAVPPEETRPNGENFVVADANMGTVPLLAVCGLLLLAVGLAFGQAAVYPFVNWDDPLCVSENPNVQKGLTLESLGWAFGDRYAGSWVPLTWISHILDWQLYRDRGGGHHLTNLLLHAATAVLLFLVLKRMTGRLWPSALVAAVFAVHPLRVESVAWVTERKDVLSGFFYVLTLAAYAGYVRRPGSIFRYLAVIVGFAMGLMAKPSLVALPFLLLLLDYWPLGRIKAGRFSARWRTAGFEIPARVVLEKLPLLALSAASSVVTMWAQGAALGVNEQYDVSWRIGNAFVSYVVYLGRFFCPVNLGPAYSRLPPNFPREEAAVAFLVLLAVTLLAWGWRRTRPYFLVGWLWYLGTMLPAIGLVQFGVQSVADRFTYLTQIGLAIALAWAAADAIRALPGPGRVLVGATAAVSSVLMLAALTVGAWLQTSYWSDPVTFWTHALACDSRKVVVHTSLGDAYAAKSRWMDAIAQYDEALRLEPKCVEAAANRGVVLRHMGHVDDAIGQYKKAIAIQDTPETRHVLATALVEQGRLPEAVEQLGQCLKLKDDPGIRDELASLLAEMGRTEDALGQYQAALRLKPDDARTHALLGSLLARLDRLPDAVPQLREAIRLDPKNAQACYELAEALRSEGIARRDGALVTEAVANYRMALEANPNDVLARTNLGVTLMLLHRPGEAIEQCRRVLAIRPDWAEAHNCMAAAYAQTGQFPEAVAAARTALKFAEQQQKKDLMEGLRARIPLYQAGKTPE
jgi:tetratricopeptide (TPR) repeat protein